MGKPASRASSPDASASLPAAPKATPAQCMQHLAALAHLAAADAIIQANTAKARHAAVDFAVSKYAGGIPVAEIRRPSLIFLRQQAHEALRAILAAGNPPRHGAVAGGRRRTGASKAAVPNSP